MRCRVFGALLRYRVRLQIWCCEAKRFETATMRIDRQQSRKLIERTLEAPCIEYLRHETDIRK